MVDVAGQDATDEFEDIGHSNDARAQLKQYEIGKIKGDVKQEKPAKAAAAGGSKTSASGRQDISGQNGPCTPCWRPWWPSPRSTSSTSKAAGPAAKTDKTRGAHEWASEWLTARRGVAECFGAGIY